MLSTILAVAILLLTAIPARPATEAEKQAAIDAGLAWLAGQQEGDGRWEYGDPGSDIAATGAALLAFIEEMGLPQGVENSLVSKLENAIDSMEKGQYNAAANQLNAFINQVEAQRGKKIKEEKANALITAAQSIIDNISIDKGGKKK